MAITQIIAATTAEVLGSSATFTTADRGFWLYGSGFSWGETAVVEGLGADGITYEVKTNASGPIGVSGCPNVVYVDLPAGTYRVHKPKTLVSASVGYAAA